MVTLVRFLIFLFLLNVKVKCTCQPLISNFTDSEGPLWWTSVVTTQESHAGTRAWQLLCDSDSSASAPF